MIIVDSSIIKTKSKQNQNKLCDFSPQATAACRRS
jgi:hypothetical protein